MSTAREIDIEQVLDGLSLRGLPLWVTAAMAAVLIADGFDIILPTVAIASLALAAALGAEISPLGLLAVYVLIAGFGLTALLQTSYPLAASVYPTDVRATGIGFAFGFGRLGAVSSSAVTAAVISLRGPALIFAAIASAAAGIGGAVLSLRRHIPAQAGIGTTSAQRVE